MRITLIAAASANNVIGNRGQIPWRLPDDLKRFRALTQGHPVIMGRKTFDSIGHPLPGRLNIVVSRKANRMIDGCTVVASLDEALAAAHAAGTDETFVIGGGQLYAAALELANRIELTRVHAEVEGDAFFPHFEHASWHLTSSVDHPADEWHPDSFTFETWDRKPI